MKIGALLLLIAPLLVPIWILVDSKERDGKYSWGWAVFLGLGLFGLAAQSGRDLQAVSGIDAPAGIAGMLWGKVAAAYFGAFWIYRSGSGEKQNSKKTGDKELGESDIEESSDEKKAELERALKKSRKHFERQFRK